MQCLHGGAKIITIEIGQEGIWNKLKAINNKKFIEWKRWNYWIIEGNRIINALVNRKFEFNRILTSGI
jgi:hypothetical protein